MYKELTVSVLNVSCYRGFDIVVLFHFAQVSDVVVVLITVYCSKILNLIIGCFSTIRTLLLRRRRCRRGVEIFAGFVNCRRVYVQSRVEFNINLEKEKFDNFISTYGSFAGRSFFETGG